MLFALELPPFMGLYLLLKNRKRALCPSMYLTSVITTPDAVARDLILKQVNYCYTRHIR
jgi:hypothetical protein